MMLRPSFGYAEALTRAFPGLRWELNGDDYSGLVWHSKEVRKPTKKRLDKEIDLLNAEWDANEYRLLRQNEYPELGEFADAVYWLRNGDEAPMIAYEAKIAEVKAKYPKPDQDKKRGE